MHGGNALRNNSCEGLRYQLEAHTAMAKEIEHTDPVVRQHLRCRGLLIAIAIFPAFAFICLLLYLRFSTDSFAYFLWGRIIAINSPRWGYIDRSNKLKVDFNSIRSRFYPCFMGPFMENRARIQIANLAGEKQYLFIDKRGAKTSGTYSSLKDCSEGLAAAELSAGHGFGFIDQSGRWAIKPIYKNAQSFSEGLAAVQNRDDNLWGYVDRTGRIAIPLIYSSAGEFHEGLAVVSSRNKYGYLDKKGNRKIPLIYDFGWRFSEGLAAVDKDFYRSNKSERTYLNHQGLPVFKYGYDKHPHSNRSQDPTFSDGLALKHADGRYGYIDKTGRFAISPRFSFARPLKGNRAIITLSQAPGIYGAIDTTGKQVLPCKFKQLGDFSDGLAMATIDGIRFGYVDSSGDIAIQPHITGIPEAFSDGLAAIGRAPQINL